MENKLDELIELQEALKDCLSDANNALAEEGVTYDEVVTNSDGLEGQSKANANFAAGLITGLAQAIDILESLEDNE